MHSKAGFFTLFASLCFFGSGAWATTIHVPTEQPTIQAAINVAHNGDTVRVAPGTYFENINFLGKAIVVASEKGPKKTIIDGGQKDSVVMFFNKETTASVLRGFTLRNGVATTVIAGGGISMWASSAATITGNIIISNQDCFGGGVYGLGGTPIITNNTIKKNSSTCGNGGGGGIELDATYAPQIIGNVIENNSAPSGGGGGITLEGLFAPAIVSNNIIRWNHAGGQGGGIYAFNDDDALVIQNLFVGNSAAEGAGAHWQVVFNTQGPTMINNTFYGNRLTAKGGCGYCIREGSAVFLNGFYGNSILENNLFVAQPGRSAVYCSNDFSSTPPTIKNNDAYSVGGVGFGLVCSGATGVSGNFAADPLFVSTTNFNLQAGSPAINAGTNSLQTCRRRTWQEIPAS